MKISSSIFLSAILGITGIGLVSGQAQAITTFADADSTAFDAAVSALGGANPTFEFNFDSLATTNPGSLTTLSDADGNGQVLTIDSTGSLSLAIRTSARGANPISDDNLVDVQSSDSSSDSTVTFSLAQPTNYFGFYLGDQYDIGGQSTYTLTANGTDIIPTKQFGGLGNSTGSTSFTDTAGAENLTVGNAAYNFFGIVDDVTEFSSVTLTFSETGDNTDNFVFDSIIAEGAIDASVPFDFSPSMGLILVGLGFGGLKYRQAKLENKDLS